MSGYTMKGSIELIEDEQTFESGFSKREFVVNTGGDYPQQVKFETVKDKTALLEKVAEGQSVEVHFNIRGKEYNGKYFNNLQAWKIVSDGAAPNANSQPEPEF